MDQRTASVTATAAQTQGSITSGISDQVPLGQFLDEMVARQVRLLEALGGVIMLRPTREHPEGKVARYLSEALPELTTAQMKRLAEIGTQAAREDRSVSDQLAAARGLLSARPEYRVIASPLRLAGQTQGAAICVLADEPGLDVAERIVRLELSSLMLESFLWRQQAIAEAQSKIQLRETLDLLDKSQQGGSAQEMAALFAQELQRRFGCLRVSIGLVHGHDVRVRAVSGTDEVDRRSELAEALEAAMEECADQDVEVLYPQPEGTDPSQRRVVRAHESLSRRFGPTACAAFPLRVDGDLVGVVLMEREFEDPFTDATLRLLRLIAEYIGPAIWTRRLADRGMLAVTRDRVVDLSTAMVGPEKTGPKLLGLLAVVLLLLAIFVPVPDRVKGEGRIIAMQRRMISAPFTARIDEVLVRPGDRVEAGQSLLRLDTRETRVQMIERQNESNRLRIQADEARSQGKLAEAAMLEAQLGQAQADVEILRLRLEQAEMRAPISGVITQGNLEDMIGEVVDPTRGLLEIAQLDTITAVVMVPERAVIRLREGQRGKMTLTARPGEDLEFEVVRITPAAELYEQQNAYRVEVALESPPSWLRPGMEGQAKVFGEQTNMLTILTRPAVDAVRLWLWI